MAIDFAASLHAVKIDHEGEATVVLKLPVSELGSVALLHGLLQAAFKVHIEPM